MHTIYTPTGHLAHLLITDREDLNDARYGIDAAERVEMRKCLDLAFGGLASGGKYIRKQAERFPDNPVFQNHLGKWHDFREEREEAIAVFERTHERFPDYLFANVSMATTRIAQERPVEALQFLGLSLRIEDRFPDRKEFHIGEVEAYENACIRYFISTEQLDRAQERVEALRSVSDDKEWLDELEYGITMELVAKRYAADRAELATMPQMEFAEQPVSPNADRELVLEHDGLRLLFDRSMDLKPEELRGILALPREALVRDLGAIVQHSIDRFHHYKENEDDYWYDQLSFVHHALQILGEIGGADSLEIVLLALSQSQEYQDLYLGDWLTEEVWEPLMKLAEGNLDRLDAFMRVPHLHAFSKVVVSESVNQLGQHRPHLLPQVEQWYAGLLAFYYAAKLEEEVMDATQLGLMVGDVLDLGLSSLLPAIEGLYARGIVPTGMSGTIERVREEFNKGISGRFKRALLSLEERYSEMAEMELSAAEDDDDDDEWEDDGLDNAPLVTLPIKRATPKVGRNEPCTCGSGKKFKKCCEGKTEAQATPALR